MGTTEDLARFIAETHYEDPPGEVEAAAKIGILDGVANLLAGSTQPVAQIISAYTQELGGTAAAAKILRLTQKQVQMALGIAASRTGGLFANNGTMVKSTHPGNAARMATEAALLARRGFISNDTIFESPRGYVSVLFDDCFDWDGFLADAGKVFHLVNPGFNIKRYPAQIGMQPVMAYDILLGLSDSAAHGVSRG